MSQEHHCQITRHHVFASIVVEGLLGYSSLSRNAQYAPNLCKLNPSTTMNVFVRPVGVADENFFDENENVFVFRIYGMALYPLI